MKASLAARTLLGVLACAIIASARVEAQDVGAASSAETVEHFEGVATTEQGTFAYRETHEVRYVSGVPLQSITRYFDQHGKGIAELRSDYRANRYAPRYTFTDAQGRTREAAEWVGGGVRFQHDRESKLVKPDTEHKVRTVFGQGLHQLVRATLRDLAAGKKLTVNFGIPSRFDFYGFRIQRAAPPRGDVVRLEVEINDWFLRIFAPKLEVDYDKNTRRLLWYRGVSNLPGPGGEVQRVTIRYTYPASIVAPKTTAVAAAAP